MKGVFRVKSLPGCFKSAWIRKYGSTRAPIAASYNFTPSSVPFLDMTLGQVVDRIADTNGNDTGIIVQHQNIRKSFSEFSKDVEKVAAGFMSLGFQRGSRIGILSTNNYEWILSMFAAAKAGLVLVNINPASQAKEVEYCLRKVGCSGLVSVDAFKKRDYYDLLLSVIPELESSNPGALSSPRVPDLKHVIMITKDSKPGTWKFDEVSEAGSSADVKKLQDLENVIQFDDLVNIQYTSGTTGNPKGTMLSHFNMVNNGYSIGHRWNYHKDKTVICLGVPLFHCFGNVVGILSSILHAGTCVIPAPHFNAQASLQAISNYKCTVNYGTPTMYTDILHNPELSKYDLSSLKKGVMSGAPCPEKLIRDVSAKLQLDSVLICYGTTETSPVITANPSTPLTQKHCMTVGFPLSNVEIKVVDKENRIVPRNTPGELCSRGYLTFLGYWDDEAKTKEVVKNNWYHTGDEAVMDNDGYVKIVGRIKEMLIRGGENIFPREIEEFLYKHPAVAEAQIIGVPDERLGEEICAWIKLKAGQTVDEQGIRDYCKGNISHFKIPRYIFFVDEFPKTASGKIQKFKMLQDTIKMLEKK